MQNLLCNFITIVCALSPLHEKLSRKYIFTQTTNSVSTFQNENQERQFPLENLPNLLLIRVWCIMTDRGGRIGHFVRSYSLDKIENAIEIQPSKWF